MKKYLSQAVFAVSLLCVSVAFADTHELVILHTNDTHSQIDPTDKGFGGIHRRKAFVDSVRSAQENVLLIDAGDAVQGTLFFTLYGGEVEMNAMNELGYDLQILGNHDFDNGMEKLAENVARSNAKWLASNYQFADSALAGRFAPYAIYEFDGKKIGFLGLNLDPDGMIAAGNADGVTYLDAVEAANATAWWLKHRLGADMVVAVSHLGYEGVPSPSDRDIISSSRNIDLLLGGHSHTLLSPGSGKEWVLNAEGDSILVAQNGKSGEYISEITINLDSLAARPKYRQIRLGESYNASEKARELEKSIRPYRKGVDDLMNEVIGSSAIELPNDQDALLNFLSDFVALRGSELNGDKGVDLALMNRGSLRRGLPKGDITKGAIISMQPFTNRIQVLSISGADLLEAIKVFALRDGDGLSSSASATYDPASHELITFTLNGVPVDPNATYTVATIDYLANGGDYMTPLTRGKVIASSDAIVYDDLINYISSLTTPISPSTAPRFIPVPRPH